MALVLDTAVSTLTADSTFESAVSLIAGVGVELAQQGYAIDRLVAGENIYRLRATRPEASIDPLLELLAGVGPSGPIDWPSVALSLLSQGSGLSTVVCVVLDWSSANADFVEHLHHHGMRVRPIVVHDDGRLAAGNPHAL